MTSSLKNVFQASQDEFFSVLESRLSVLEQQLREYETRIEGLAEIGDKLATRALALSSRGAPPSAWIYDARMPNRQFTDVFEPERIDGNYRRWVGTSGRLSGKLLLDRRFQYELEVTAMAFVTPEAEASFRLLVDGQPWPWLTTENHCYKSIIAEAPDASELEFAFEVAPESRPADRDVTFSICSIRFSKIG